MADTKEPQITINGHELTPGQAMTVRVAIELAADHIEHAPELGPIGRAYMARIEEIRRLVFNA